MKKYIVSLALVSFALSVPAVALATTVGLPGLNIQTNQNNPSVNLQATPGGVNIQTQTGTGDVNLQNLGGSGLQVQTGGQTIQLKDVDGNTLRVNTSTGGLSVQLGDSVLSVQSKGAIVSLQGAALSLLQSQQDFDAYNQLVIETRPNVNQIELENGKVRVEYNQPAKFLGIFATDVDASAYVDSNGVVEVRMPWYGFFFRGNSRAVEASLQGAITSATANRKVSISALAGGSNKSVQIQNGAKVVNIMTSVVGNKNSVVFQKDGAAKTIETEGTGKDSETNLNNKLKVNVGQ